MLSAVIRRYRKPDPAPIDERPRSAYEALTRQMLNDLRAQVQSVETKVNGLLFGMLAIVIAEVYRAVTR